MLTGQVAGAWSPKPVASAQGLVLAEGSMAGGSGMCWSPGWGAGPRGLVKVLGDSRPCFGFLLCEMWVPAPPFSRKRVKIKQKAPRVTPNTRQTPSGGGRATRR